MQRDVPDFFGFYPYEFCADERVLGMTLEQVGAYVLLLCAQWINGSIPSDIPALARILKRTTAEMEILWAGVGPCFQPHAEREGRLVQPRLEAERCRTIEAIQVERKRQADYRAKRKGVHVAHADETGTTHVQNSDTAVSSTLLSLCTNSNNNQGVTPKLRAVFDRLVEKHPNCTDVDFAYQVWMGHCDAGVVTEENAHEVEEGLDRYIQSELWGRDGGRYVVSFGKWLHKKMWKDHPAQSEASKVAGRSRKSSAGTDPLAEWVPEWKK